MKYYKHVLMYSVLSLYLQDPAATTPSKASKKDKKDKKSKKGEKATMNGDDGDHDRASPEINSQEQMAAQRASGGVIDAPPEVLLMQIFYFYSFKRDKISDSFNCLIVKMFSHLISLFLIKN